ncbi:MAG: DUF2225 domain-containing protein [candidate division Zixibacteria bacterium]|nr:DUF2225 domain-containing protein [candidate division Zixibacteria bacterium]
MANESPFLNIKVECPVCQTINEFEQIKVGAFNENGRDTDFCPQEILWRYPKYQAYNPLVFFTATCSNCFYTREFSNKYRDWKTDNAFRNFQLKTIKPKHLEQLSQADSVVRQLGEAINIHRYPNESAILKLHLAIFDAYQVDHPSSLDLGRFYLRIGWIFRSLNESDDPNLSLLSGLVTEIGDKFAGFEAAMSDSQKALDELAESVKAQFDADQLPAELQSEMFTYRDRYEVEMMALNDLVGQVGQQRKEFKALFNEYGSAILGSSNGDGPVSFGEYASLTDFLIRLQQNWSGIAINEHQALEQAIGHYKDAFANGRDIAAGNQQIQASYLIAELSRRIGDYDGAKQFFTSTIKTGQEYIYQNRRDQSRTVLARKILELAIEQGRANLQASKQG